LKKALAMGVAVLVGVACSIQTIFPGGTESPPGSASQLVGAGGAVVSANDGTSVFVPPNAVSTDITVTIGLGGVPEHLPKATPLAASHVFGPQWQTFARPVCITASFEPGLLPEGGTENNVVLYVSGGDAQPFVPLPTMASGPTQVTGMTSVLQGPVVVAYGEQEESDAGEFNCDASQLDAAEEGDY
jgi:hypothetical protein